MTTSDASAPEMSPHRAWLVIAAGENRQHGGNDGYDDRPRSHYSWDSTVPNSRRMVEGDVIVLWDKQRLLGASIIEDVEEWNATKTVRRCPACAGSKIKARKTLTPRWRCHECRTEFETANEHEIEVIAYRADHGSGWVDLEGLLRGDELRRLCLSPRSQLSLRPLDWMRFRDALRNVGVRDSELGPLLERLRDD